MQYFSLFTTFFFIGKRFYVLRMKFYWWDAQLNHVTTLSRSFNRGNCGPKVGVFETKVITNSVLLTVISGICKWAISEIYIYFLLIFWNLIFLLLIILLWVVTLSLLIFVYYFEQDKWCFGIVFKELTFTSVQWSCNIKLWSHLSLLIIL